MRKLIPLTLAAMVLVAGNPSAALATSEPTIKDPRALRVSGLDFRWPSGFQMAATTEQLVSGVPTTLYDSQTYRYQQGTTIANGDNSVICSTGFELALPKMTASTAFAQINAAANAGSILNVRAVETGGIAGQERLVSLVQSNNIKVIEVSREYFVPESRFVESNAAVFYLSCRTPVFRYSRSEATMRLILKSATFY